MTRRSTVQLQRRRANTILVTGAPLRFNAPVGAPAGSTVNCDVVYSVDRLRDGGFEDQTGGPAGDEIPWIEQTAYPDIDIAWPSEDPTYPTKPPLTIGWFQNVDQADQRWRLSTANPRSGTTHARSLWQVDDSRTVLYPVGIDTHDCGVFPTEGIHRWQSARVAAGDTVTCTWYVADHQSLTGNFATYFTWYGFDGAGTGFSAEQKGTIAAPVGPANGQYGQVVHAATVFDLFPTFGVNTDWVQIRLGWDNAENLSGAPLNTPIDVDDVTVVVTP